MKKVVAACLSVLLIGLAGCQTLGFSDEKKEIKPKPAATTEEGTPSKVAWQLNIGSTDKLARLSPAVVGDRVFAASQSGAIVSVTTDGHLQWQIDAGFKIMAGVGADQDMVVVAGPKGILAAFDAKTGGMLWKETVNGEVAAPPLVASNVIIIRALDGRVLGFNRADGKRKWGYQRVIPSLILRRAAPMTLAEQYIFVGYPGGKLVVLEQERGTLVFEESVSTPKGSNELERLTDIASRPIVHEHQVCVGAYQGRVGCFNLRGGNAMWFKNLSSIGGVDISRHAVFAVGDDGFLYSFDRDMGTERWKAEVLPEDTLIRPVVFNDVVTVGDSFGFLHYFSAVDGKPLGRMAVDNNAFTSPPVVVPGRGLVVQTLGGKLALLVP